jgi:glycosyltransferase involved in cell wall biosynthesis
MGVYNGERYLHEAVTSILNQTYKDFEFIIIDDASTDSTNSILSSFNDARIKVIKNQTNLGLTKSLNKGLAQASGKYIARMDADDISDVTRFEKQVEFLDQNENIAMCGTWKSSTANTGEVSQYPVTHDEIKLALLSHNPFAHPSVMWRKDVFETQGFEYNERYVTSQDYELWSRAIYTIRAANIAEPLLHYRTHGAQITASRQDQQSLNARKIKLKQLHFLHLEPNATEERAHLCVFDGMFKTYKDAAHVRNADEWMHKIFLANKEYNVFNERLLLQFWRSVFFGTGLFYYDLAIWKVLMNSWCVKLCNVSFAEKTRQFVKCLLQWKINSPAVS